MGSVGQTSNGIMSEEPELFGRLLLLTALPGTQGIYGFLVGFIAVMRLGLLSGTVPSTLTIEKGFEFFLACLPIALVGLFSAIHQGRVCATGATMTAKQPEQMGKALILGVFVEFYAILGLLISLKSSFKGNFLAFLTISISLCSLLSVRDVYLPLKLAIMSHVSIFSISS